MWGTVLGIAAAASALAIAQSVVESYTKARDQESPQQPHQLPKPEEGSKGSDKKVWTAPLWQESTAKEVLEKARRAGSKFKR